MTRFEQTTGRYVYLEVDGVEYRVYFEECGSGIPLLLQHTAGSDGRQFRHLLSDSRITDHFRVVAPDLPYHGKSLPPTGIEWWKQGYELRRDWFIEFVLAFSSALELVEPVFMGCSMGGQLAIDLAIQCPDEFRAIIGLESALESQGEELLALDAGRAGCRRVDSFAIEVRRKPADKIVHIAAQERTTAETDVCGAGGK